MVCPGEGAQYPGGSFNPVPRRELWARLRLIPLAYSWSHLRKADLVERPKLWGCQHLRTMRLWRKETEKEW